MNQVLMIAAEPSSVLYAERILQEWKASKRSVQAFGVGSKLMQSMGFDLIGCSDDMAVMGLIEILKHYRFLKSVFDQILVEVDRRKPDFAVLLDYPGFNLKLAKELKKRGIPVIYYIPPQVWAWKQDRVYQIKENCDLVLSLFPFETEFYQKYSVNVKFVGHPLLDELDLSLAETAKVAMRKSQMGFAESDIVLGLMPGSRRSELEFNFPTQLLTARNLMQKYSNLKLVVMVAPNFEKSDLEPFFDNFRLPYVMLKDEPFKMIQAVDLVLVTSGTATLVVGLMEKPMIIMYKVKALTAFLARFLVPKDFIFGLVNVMHGRKVAPEIMQAEANPKRLTEELDRLIQDEKYRFEMIEKMKQLKFMLGERGATRRVVAALEPYFKSDHDKGRYTQPRPDSDQGKA